MMKNKQFNLDGFTLTETLVNMVIVASIFFPMIFLFFQLNVDYNIENSRSDAIMYGNLVLDELVEELSKSQTVREDGQTNVTDLMLTFANTDTTTQFIINTNRGVIKNNEVIGGYLPKDDQNRYKYKITRFVFNDSPPIEAGDIISSFATPARNASFVLKLDIELYDTSTDDPSKEYIETLEFERRVFSPSKFLHNIVS